MCRTKYPGVTKEGHKESVKRLRKWVKKGKTWAQLMLGGMYKDGEGVKKDEKRAIVLSNYSFSFFYHYLLPTLSSVEQVVAFDYFL